MPAESLSDLRRRVLLDAEGLELDPQALIDPSDHHPTVYHFGGVNDLGCVVAAASFYPAESPLFPGESSYQLRYLAVDPSVQGHGRGSLLLQAAEKELSIRVRPDLPLFANARDTALGFYQKIGWLPVPGSHHVSPISHLPHTKVTKRIG